MFDRLYLNRHFLKNQRGEIVFYPFGRRRRGYFLPADKESDMKQAMRLQVIAFIIAILALTFLSIRLAVKGFGVSWLDEFGLGAWFALILCLVAYSRIRLVHGLIPASTDTAREEQ
ncbi:MAG: hypothetical protein QM780_02740 [Hyphomicrobium sp.]|uniref:hypothetical protein n=1 Tax=Hyphomicrobium sp. TaxID=82 RepID=UPI0039E32314